MTQTAIDSLASHEPRTYLTAWQRKDLRNLIVDRLGAYRERATQAANSLCDFFSSDSLYEREIARDTLNSLVDGVREHENALRRIDSGNYGTCSVCARPIPFERLLCIPEVNQCVKCARAR